MPATIQRLTPTTSSWTYTNTPTNIDGIGVTFNRDVDLLGFSMGYCLGGSISDVSIEIREGAHALTSALVASRYIGTVSNTGPSVTDLNFSAPVRLRANTLYTLVLKVPYTTRNISSGNAGVTSFSVTMGGATYTASFTIAEGTNNGTGVTNGQIQRIVVQEPNVAPNAPSNLNPSGTSAVPNVQATLTPSISWSFTDPDAGNSQSAYQVIVKEGATVVHDTGKVASGSTSVVIPAGKLAPDKTYNYTVQTWDNYDAVSPISAVQYFKTTKAPIPTQTAPLGTVGTPGGSSLTPTLTWDYFDADAHAQKSFQVRIKNTGGSVVHDSGVVTSANKSYTVPANVLTAGTTYYWELQVTDSTDMSSGFIGSQYFITNYPPPSMIVMRPAHTIRTITRPIFEAVIGNDVENDSQHFVVQLADDAAFTVNVQERSTKTAVTGWEIKTVSGNYVAMPASGAPASYEGGSVKYKWQEDLFEGKTYYWRMAAIDGATNTRGEWTSIQTNANFIGKIAGSTTANPHIVKIDLSPTFINPSAFSVSWAQNGYDFISKLDGICGSVFTSAVAESGQIAKTMFSFNLIEHVQRTYGTIPGSTTADKVAWLRMNIPNLTFKWWGFGSSATGNKARILGWNDKVKGYFYEAVHTSSNVQVLITNTTTDTKDLFDANGFVHFLVVAEPSDGTTASVINTDYVELQIELKNVSTAIRVGNILQFRAKDPVVTSAPAERIVLTMQSNIANDGTLPASLKVEASNNALDASPTWEDVTSKVNTGNYHDFTNKAKTAANWAVSYRVTIEANDSLGPIEVQGLGISFD